MSALTKQALNDGLIRIVARITARDWRRLCQVTGKRPIMDNIMSQPGFEREKLSLVMALSHLTEELSKQDGWDSTNPDCPEPTIETKGSDSIDEIVKGMVEEALELLRKADTLHGQPLYYTEDGHSIDIDEVFAPTIEGLNNSISNIKV